MGAQPLASGTPVGRARIVLLAAAGQQDKQIATAMQITPKKVSRWRSRFLTLGMTNHVALILPFSTISERLLLARY
jgi:DNA-binding NarL/FixJ family response regulator